MNDSGKKYKNVIVVAVSMILPIILMFYTGRSKLPFVRKFLVGVTTPISYLTGIFFNSISGVWENYIYLVNIKKENERLKKENAFLLNRLAQFKKLKFENARLKKLLNFVNSNEEYTFLPAKVIGKSISPFSKSLIIKIDKGKKDKIEKLIPVVTPEGLVGRVSNVFDDFAEVMLIIDKKSRVDVKILGKGIVGTIVGTGSENRFLAKFMILYERNDIEKNDTVVTSGLDGIFPPNIEVGYILSVDYKHSGIFYQYEVVPAVDFTRIEEVLLITGKKESK